MIQKRLIEASQELNASDSEAAAGRTMTVAKKAAARLKLDFERF